MTTTAPLSPTLGKQIAELINERECGEIIMRRVRAAQPYNHDRYTVGRNMYRRATEALRALGIPTIV